MLVKCRGGWYVDLYLEGDVRKEGEGSKEAHKAQLRVEKLEFREPRTWLRHHTTSARDTHEPERFVIFGDGRLTFYSM